jgi:hypothetical protein
MNYPQRIFLMVGLILLAAGLALYCLDYRIVRADSSEGEFYAHLMNLPEPQRQVFEADFDNDLKFRGWIPLVNLGNVETSEPDWPSGYRPTLDELHDKYAPRFRAIFPGQGLTKLEAIVGGALIPFLLVMLAGFLGLGTRINSATKGSVAATPDKFEVASEGRVKVTQPPPITIDANLDASRVTQFQFPVREKLAVIAMAFFPFLLLADLPSMMSATRCRYPRWVFVLHCLYVFGRR